MRKKPNPIEPPAVPLTTPPISLDPLPPTPPPPSKKKRKDCPFIYLMPRECRYCSFGEVELMALPLVLVSAFVFFCFWFGILVREREERIEREENRRGNKEREEKKRVFNGRGHV